MKALTKKRKIKNLAYRSQQLRRWGLKGLSVFFALSLWFYVLNSEPLEIEKKIPVDFILPKGLAIANLVTPEVSVKVKGSRAFLRNLFENDEKIFLNLKSYPYKSGRPFNVHINPSDVPVHFGVDVLEIYPEEIEVVLQKKISKKVPVKAQLVGEVPSDLRLIKHELKPATVLISGPIEEMRKTTFVKTMPVDLSSLQGEGSIKTQVTELDRRIEVKIEEAIEFSYVVRPQKANLTLKKIPIRFLTSGSRIRSKIREVSLDVLASEGRKITHSEVQVVADIPEGKKGWIDVKLQAILPAGVHLLQIHPESIKVRVR